MKKILLIGDSTVQWIRPNRNHKSNFTYFEHLRKNKIDIEIFSSPGMTTNELLKFYWNDYSCKFADVIIVSLGINDLTRRSYPRWLWKINNNKFHNLTLKDKIFNFFYRILTNRYFQKKMSDYNFSKPWVNKQLFELNLKKFQDNVLKESDSKIIYLLLPSTSDRVLSILKHTNSDISSYKKIFKKLIEKDRVSGIDIEELFESNPTYYNSEGIHYTSEGHKLVYLEIIKKLNEIEDNK